MKTVVAAVFLIVAGAACAMPSAVAATPSGSSPTATPEIAAIRVNGVELHYTDRGSGPPIVFVHGGLADYRELSETAAALPGGFRTITYSRRHSFPNRNPRPGTDHSMMREVEDLAGLIETLGLGPVHLVGTSYGAFTSLMFALHRPDLVRSVVAAEPPLLHWLPDIEGGVEAQTEFDTLVMKPSAAAFADDDPRRALTVALDYFVGPGGIDLIPAEFRDMLLANIEDWRAITTAPLSLPRVTREEMSRISVPVLLISGGKTADVHRLVDPVLAQVIPTSRRAIIAEGSHEMCSEQPAACAAAIADFLRLQGH